MKKIFLTLAATAVCTTAFAAVGDVTTILDQTFEEGTTLTDGTNYQWGSDIQGMITADGISLTNSNSTENNYENRAFLTFPSKQPIGSATNAVNVSYTVYNAKGKGQALTFYEVDFFDGKNKFLFGIREGIGDDWKRPSYIITANAEGEKSDPVQLPDHMIAGVPSKDNGTGEVNLTIKFSGETAIIEIDGGSYPAYCSKEGLTAIRLSVSGDKDFKRGVYIKNFKIDTEEVNAVQTANYTLKYVCGSETLKEVSKAGPVGDPIVINADETAPLWNSDNTKKYIFVSDDAAGKTIESGAVVTLTYREAASWNYTVKNNVNDKTITGTCIEGESVKVPYHRYILAENGIVWLKDATNKEYNISFTPSENNFVAELDYSVYQREITDENEEKVKVDVTDGVYFVEGEDIEGMTATSANNANVRCSNAAAGYVAGTEENPAGPVDICTLSAGTYQVEIAGWGGAGTDLIVKAGEETVLKVTTTGSWAPGTSAAFTLAANTTLTFEGATSSRPLDYVLITGTGKVVEGGTTAVEAIEAVKDGKWYNLQGVQVAEPTVKGLYIHNGKKVIVK